MLGWEGGGLSEGIGVGLKQEMGVRSVVRQVRRRPVDDDTSPPSSTSTRLDDPSDPWHLVRPPSPRPSPTALRADPTLCRPLSSVRPANRPADRRHLACRARARPRARPRLPARTALAGPLVRPLVPVRAPSQPPLALLHGRERADTARPPPPFHSRVRNRTLRGPRPLRLPSFTPDVDDDDDAHHSSSAGPSDVDDDEAFALVRSPPRQTLPLPLSGLASPGPGPPTGPLLLDVDDGAEPSAVELPARVERSHLSLAAGGAVQAVGEGIARAEAGREGGRRAGAAAAGVR